MIFKVAILLDETKLSNFNAQNNLIDYILWPKNAILCWTTYTWPGEGQNMWLWNLNEAENILELVNVIKLHKV